MSDHWRRLDAGETVLWEASPRRTRALPGVIVSVIGLTGVFVIAYLVHWLSLVLVPVALVPGVWSDLRVRRTVYLLSDRAITVKTGVFGLSVRRVEYDRVQNVGYSQGVFGSLFGYGTVAVDVAGGRDVRLLDVYDPTEPYATIRGHAGRRSAGVPGTLAEWQAIRDEVRTLRTAIEGDSAE